MGVAEPAGSRLAARNRALSMVLAGFLQRAVGPRVAVASPAEVVRLAIAVCVVRPRAADEIAYSVGTAERPKRPAPDPPAGASARSGRRRSRVNTRPDHSDAPCTA